MHAESVSETTSNNQDLESLFAAQKAQLSDLATMGAVVTSIHELDSVLSVVMDMALQLVKGEVGLLLIEENGKLRSRISWGVEESFVRSLKYKDDIDIVSYCFEHAESVMLCDLNVESETGIRIDTILALPLKTRDKCLGILILINKSDGNNYSDDDKMAIEMLLNFVAVAVENASLLKEQLKQQRIKQEMAIAKQVQETILPKQIENFAGAEIGAIYFPAGEVSGDFYDVFRISENKFLAMIGDVSSKGVPAALVMSASAGIIKSLLSCKPDMPMSELTSRLNDILVNDIIRDREMFVTLFFAKFDMENNKLTYCNGGHMPGLYWDNEAKKIVDLAEGGPIVGQFSGIEYRQGERKINPDDRLFLFTDGLTEAEDSQGNLFGRERVEQVFSSEIGLAPREFCLTVKQWVDKFAVGSAEESRDDFTILQIRVDI